MRFCVFLHSVTWGEGVVIARSFACALLGFAGVCCNGVWSGEVGEKRSLVPTRVKLTPVYRRCFCWLYDVLLVRKCKV